MGGGQAGAPADDDHVPWTRPPPGVATVSAEIRHVTARVAAAGPTRNPEADPEPMARSRPERPSPCGTEQCKVIGRKQPRCRREEQGSPAGCTGARRRPERVHSASTERALEHRPR